MENLRVVNGWDSELCRHVFAGVRNPQDIEVYTRKYAYYAHLLRVRIFIVSALANVVIFTIASL